MEQNTIYMTNIKYKDGVQSITVFKDNSTFVNFIEQIATEIKRAEQLGQFIHTFTAVIHIDENFKVTVIDCSEQYVIFDFIFENKQFVDIKWFIFANQEDLYKETITNKLTGQHFIQFYDNENIQYSMEIIRS